MSIAVEPETTVTNHIWEQFHFLFLWVYCVCGGLMPCLPHSPADSVAVMSIDLGSEWLKVALVKPGVPMEIVLNK